MLGDETPCVGKSVKSKKNLLQINSKTKKKKKLFPELTFVESHMDTFYVGLNDNLGGAYNPVKAKCVDIDEAKDLAKDWVFKQI